MPGTSCANWCAEAQSASRHPFNCDLIHDDVRNGTISGLGWCLADLSNDVHSIADLSKYRMPAVQVWSRHQCNEELTAIRVGSGVRHRKDTFRVVLQLGMKLVGKLISGSAASGACGISALDHETVDHSVEYDAVIEFRICELDEIAHRIRHELFEQFDGEVAQRCFKVRVGALFHFSIVAF